MINGLWLAAAALLIIAALFAAWAVLRDPRQPRKRALHRSFRDGVIDQPTLQQQLSELNREPGKRRIPLALVLLLAVPFGGLLIYGQVGSPHAVNSPIAQNQTPTGQQPGPNQQQPEQAMSMEDAISGLQQRLRESPDNLDGWLLLGNSLKSIQRYEEALEAYQQANRLAPQDPSIQVELAEAMLFASGEPRIPEQVTTLLQQAVESDPQQAKGLWLLGLAAFQNEAFEQALDYWQRLRPLVRDEQARLSINQQIAAARQALGLPVAVDNTSTAQPDNTAQTGRLQVTIHLDPAVAEVAPQAGALFVFARLPQGGPPLASKRLPPGPFPLTIHLSDADAMIASRKLSTASEVVIGARWSGSGNPLPQPGDLQGFSDSVRPGSQDPIQVRLNEQVQAKSL